METDAPASGCSRSPAAMVTFPIKPRAEANEVLTVLEQQEDLSIREVLLLSTSS